ncbi:hypothetical protein DFH08DRAFT_816047 [Mycena albidolilacea]|uniref:Uncharacterized protein n=1 Tax=Mycena albidolilacea TaxID=1033008 RepID=A0AAD7EIB7_9AGAR|nr:hypothetical protein DFH08DRAFT_816047 [Mycena albidolilacea]
MAQIAPQILLGVSEPLERPNIHNKAYGSALGDFCYPDRPGPPKPNIRRETVREEETLHLFRMRSLFVRKIPCYPQDVRRLQSRVVPLQVRVFYLLAYRRLQVITPHSSLKACQNRHWSEHQKLCTSRPSTFDPALVTLTPASLAPTEFVGFPTPVTGFMRSPALCRQIWYLSKRDPYECDYHTSLVLIQFDTKPGCTLSIIIPDPSLRILFLIACRCAMASGDYGAVYKMHDILLDLQRVSILDLTPAQIQSQLEREYRVLTPPVGYGALPTPREILEEMGYLTQHKKLEGKQADMMADEAKEWDGEGESVVRSNDGEGTTSHDDPEDSDESDAVDDSDDNSESSDTGVALGARRNRNILLKMSRTQAKVGRLGPAVVRARHRQGSKEGRKVNGRDIVLKTRTKRVFGTRTNQRTRAASKEENKRRRTEISKSNWGKRTHRQAPWRI